ncbi:MAG TPA: hypothetical protein VFV23_10255 [Verrucomicrobiae bacterium]|nr:hypothetical protein [Verrucomicrobiae bacterium]
MANAQIAWTSGWNRNKTVLRFTSHKYGRRKTHHCSSCEIRAILLFVGSIVGSILVSPWWLLSIPSIAIGMFFTAPNLNLINGMPSYLSMPAGFVLMRFHEPAGLAVFAGVAVSFYGCAIEMRIFSKPYGG